VQCKLKAFFLTFQFIFVFQIVQYKPLKYGSDYEYPTWAEIVGVCLSFSSMIWIPGYALYYIIITPGSFKEVNLNVFICKLYAYEKAIPHYYRTFIAAGFIWIVDVIHHYGFFSERSERSATKHKIACKVTKGRKISRDTHVGEQRRLNYEK